MSNTESTVYEEFSLAELSEMDTDEVKVLTSRLPMAGIWTVVMLGVALSELPPKDDKPKTPVVTHKFESISIEPAVKNPDLDPDTLIGRKLTDRQVLWANSPAALIEEIGYLKGKYQKVGYETKGRLGGLTEQGGEPGWLDGPVIDQQYMKIRVRHGQRNGQDTAYIDWVGPADANPGADDNA